jgi:pyridoxamine 5'-phosphate oxidase family protein
MALRQEGHFYTVVDSAVVGTASGARPSDWRTGRRIMSVFTEAELDYLTHQPLGRLATLARDSAPQVRPVGFVYNPELDTIDIGGHGMGASQKYRNVQRDSRVSFVVDDLATVDPWRPRGVEIRGRAEAIPRGEPLHEGFAAELIRIHPQRVLGWGLDSDAFATPHARTVAS